MKPTTFMTTFLRGGSQLPCRCSGRNVIHPGSVSGELLENNVRANYAEL